MWSRGSKKYQMEKVLSTLVVVEVRDGKVAMKELDKGEVRRKLEQRGSGSWKSGWSDKVLHVVFLRWCDEVERRWGLREVRVCMSADHVRQEVLEECLVEEGSGRGSIRRDDGYRSTYNVVELRGSLTLSFQSFEDVALLSKLRM